jgi:hypothetical protein
VTNISKQTSANVCKLWFENSTSIVYTDKRLLTFTFSSVCSWTEPQEMWLLRCRTFACVLTTGRREDEQETSISDFTIFKEEKWPRFAGRFMSRHFKNFCWIASEDFCSFYFTCCSSKNSKKRNITLTIWAQEIFAQRPFEKASPLTTGKSRAKHGSVVKYRLRSFGKCLFVWGAACVCAFVPLRPFFVRKHFLTFVNILLVKWIWSLTFTNDYTP